MLVGQAVVTVVVSALAIFVVACGDDTASLATVSPRSASSAASTATLPATSTPAPVPTATAAPVPIATPDLTRPATCPVAAQVCAFAQRVEMTLVAGQTADLLTGAVGLPTTCAGVRLDLDGTYPLCEGAAAGEVRNGFHIGRFQSEGVTGDASAVVFSIDEWVGQVDATQSDDIGTGAIRAYTVGCALRSDVVSCDGSFAVVLSALLKAPQADGAHREFLELFSVDASGEPHIIAMFTGLFALNQGLVNGGDEEYGVVADVQSTGPSRYMLLPG